MPKGVEIRLLGELEVARDGRALPLPASKKTRALLAYLVASARPHLRQSLCELLWPGPDDPRAALRWSLTKIRPLVDERGATRIVADRDRVGFEIAGARVDLVEVRARVSSPPTDLPTEALRDLAARFHGELLDGLDVPDAYRFQEWLTAERESVRALRLKVLGTLVDRLAGDPESALRFARERVAIDPLSEAAHVAVVRMLAQLGKRREAMEQFEACSRILENELHSRPSPALLAARMMIRPAASRTEPPPAEPAAGRPPSPPPPASPIAPPSTPLVGRARESAAIDAALDAASRVLFFSGEPGLGKTRLLGELAARATARGMRVIGGRAYEAERVRPYGAWVDALRPIVLGSPAEPRRADLAPLFPELGPAGEAIDRARLFDSVVGLLGSLAPAVVILDDLQWFDDASAALFHVVARRLPPRVLLACGARGEELADNQPVLRLVRALTKDDRIDRFDLGVLDAAATTSLVRAIAPGVDGDRVRRESAGNPLFAIEVARALSAGGDDVPGSLAALIAERLARLDDEAREIVSWAAALGRTFDLDVIARVTGLAAAALVRGFEELERRGILRASREGSEYDFVHDLIRAGAYRQLSPPRRRLVHAQIARALVGSSRLEERAGDIAHHAALGEERDLAARAYLAAGERALRVFAYADAARFADAGREYATTLPRDARIPLQVGLLHVKAMCTGLSGDRRALASEIEHVGREAEDAGLHAEVAAGLHTLSILQRDAGDAAGACASTLGAVDAASRADSAARARQLAETARCLALLEREMPRAEEMLRDASAILGDSVTASLHFLWGQGLMERFRGRFQEGTALLERTLRLARAAQDHWAECDATFSLAQTALESGDATRAVALCAGVFPVVAKMGEGSEEPVARALDALAHVVNGEADWDAALERAIARLRDVDAKGMLAYVLNFAASLDLARGRIDSARARAEEALRAAEIVERCTQTVIAHALLGKVALQAGDRTAAARHLDELRPDLAIPLRVSSRAHAAAVDLATALGASVP
jgi:DNA-binding SARP family transcriptional activator/tetratricopeptide (TPR) repeat protein